ncbi:MAG: MarR family transcriptional regulator [Deltaproteobacteria bacterium]|nr:MarR family transcriptional regulator [Deltaproteobacteria bacterium]
MSERDQAAERQLAEQAIASLLRLINRIHQHRRTPTTYGGGAPLTLLEAEICSLIEHQEGITGTELSRVLGVTRSATSQTIGKLVAKGYVEQETAPDDSKRKRLYLTRDGRRAASGAEKYRKRMLDEVFNVSKRELQSYCRFVSKMEAFEEAVRRGSTRE